MKGESERKQRYGADLYILFSSRWDSMRRPSE